MVTGWAREYAGSLPYRTLIGSNCSFSFQPSFPATLLELFYQFLCVLATLAKRYFKVELQWLKAIQKRLG